MVLNYPIVVAKIKVTGSTAEVLWSQDIPKGLVGGRVLIEYADECWNSLNKTVVFRGAVTRDVLENGSEVVIPSEVLARSGVNLYVGVYGTDAENELGIPTFWAKLGVIRDAAVPDGDPAADPSLPVWARLLERTPDWQAEPGSDNHILNRTHWYGVEAVDHTFNGDTTGMTVISADEGYSFVKVSDEIITKEALINSILTISDGGEDFSLTVPEEAIEDMSGDGIPALTVGEFVICLQQDFVFYGMSFEAGVYFLLVTDEEGIVGYVKHLSAIPSEKEVVHKLNNKYLDVDWVATRGDGTENVLLEASQKFYSSGTCQQTFHFSLEPGEKYRITWDGELFNCVCRYVSMEGYQFPYLGNLHLFNETFEDTGEPFVVVNIAILFLNLGTLMYGCPTDSETYRTVSIQREDNIRQRIPMDYMPQIYTLPTDLYYNDVDSDLLLNAYYHLQKGGAVNAVFQGDIYRVLNIYVDVFDGWYDSIVMAGENGIRFWQKRKGWFYYEPRRMTLCTSNYDEQSKSGKKYEITVDESGNLKTSDITGYTK